MIHSGAPGCDMGDIGGEKVPMPTGGGDAVAPPGVKRQSSGQKQAVPQWGSVVRRPLITENTLKVMKKNSKKIRYTI